MKVGAIASLWRYPVKSMQGEEAREAVLTERGLRGDRAFAVQERATGHIASAKHPRKWSPLFACRAEYVEAPQPDCALPSVRITLPDGAVIDSDDPNVDAVLSRALGREVTLLAEPPVELTREADRSPVDAPASQDIRQETMAFAAPGTFFDYAPLHLLTIATLARLQALYPEGRFEARRFRPNLLIATEADAGGFIENAWLKRSLRIGTEVRLHLIDPCPRCIVTTLAQGDLPRDTEILRTIAQYNAVASATLAPGVVLPAVAGVYANVTEDGWLRCGDPVWLE